MICSKQHDMVRHLVNTNANNLKCFNVHFVVQCDHFNHLPITSFFLVLMNLYSKEL